MSREVFIKDSAMLGLMADGTAAFISTYTEMAYQLWLRGYNAKALEIRDALKAEIDLSKNIFPDNDDMRDGVLYALKDLLEEWQKTKLIPRD